MKEKLHKEWFLETKWGKVAMVSWGDRHLPGVLLVHGYMDSSATFEPLLSLLPDTYHYVSFDYPGHGKSDHLATSQLVPQSFIVEIIREIISYLQWKRFVCVAHSIGCLISLLFNHLYPGRIKKLICLDPMYPISHYYNMNANHSYWYKWFFESYYDNYDLYHSAPPRLFTRDQLIQSTMKARKLNREQAEIVLSRSLVPVENGMYRSSIQPLMRRIIHLPTFRDAFGYILTNNTVPILNLHGLRSKMSKEERKFTKELIPFDNPKQVNVYVDADHDLHITHPVELLPHIVEFLNSDFKAKL